MIKNIDRNNVINYGEDSLIIVTKSNEHADPYCLKVLNDEFAQPEVLIRLENEYELCSATSSPNIRKALQKTTIDNHHAIALEFIDGMDLNKAFAKNTAKSFTEQLMLAVHLAEAVSELHRENIIHGQLNPSNILIEYITNKIFLIDFSLAARHANTISEHNFIKNAGTEELRYISPEQTGRINRNTDARSDLYSLGVILYKLFTGITPYESSDAVELIYCHIAQPPIPPDQVNTDLPKVISDIIMKLLAKNAEDRYQSAFGVHYDLETCISYLQSNKNINSIVLATNDYSGKYFIQQKLYGRDHEIKTLFHIFDECVDGDKQLLMVSGYSGSGKSALIDEIHQPIAEKNGLFIKGKFDQVQLDTPYFAFRQAFAELIKYILIADQAVQFKWKKKVNDAIGNSGKVLTDLIPGIETLIGVQPEVVDLKGVEAQNRFNYVLLNFLHATLDKDMPLVIFIDDLQWADVSSLNLIKVIMNDKDLKHLMIIGAYRNNEVNQEHPLTKLMNDLNHKEIPFSEIELTDLSYKNVYGIVHDLLRTNQQDTGVLAEIIFSKTNGNAFYVHQFLKTIYEEQYLKFDFDKREWTWNKNLILEMNVSGNVVDFIALLIQKMPQDIIDILKTASCLGNRFNKATLALVKEQSEKQVDKLLQQPLIDGLIISVSGQFKFAHDRIQQVIYSLIPDEDKKVIHLQIGKVLSANTGEEEQQESIFDIVNQWNIGADLITDAPTKLNLANLNLTAARKAVFSAAYPMGLAYFEKALELLHNDWANRYDLMLTVTVEAAESAYFSGEYDKVDNWVKDATNHSKNLTDSARAYEVSIKKLIAQNKLIEAITLGLSVLDKMGIHFTIKPGQFKTIIELLRTKWVLRNKGIEFFNNLPEMTNPETNAIMRILSDISSASYFAAPELVPLLVFKLVRLTVSDGLSRKSPYSFAAYGFILSGYMGEVDNGITYGKIAMNLMHKLKADEVSGLIRTTNNVFLNHWREPLHNTIDDLEDAFRYAMESGDNEWSSYAAQNMAYQLFVMGYPLGSLGKKTEALDQQIEKFRQDLTITRLRIFRQSIVNLTVEHEEPDVLKGEIFDEDVISLADISVNNKVYFHNLYFQKAFIALVFNMPEQARKHIEKAGEFLESVRGSVLYSLYYFYQSLAITTSITESGQPAKSSDLKIVKKNIARLKKNEKYCPENYTYKRMFIEAELARIQGDKHNTKLLYDEVLKAATGNNMLHDVALCWERAAQFFISNNDDVLGNFYMQNAYKAYQRWGAEAKVKQMPKRYKMLERTAKADQDEEKSNAKDNKNTSFIDLATVIKASSVLSGEIVLSRLLKKLMEILLENVGAQKGFFIMEKNDVRYIEAEISAGEDEKILQSIPVANSGSLAESVVNYVYHTREVVMLDDATQNVLFANDDYIKANKSKSILCVPILNRDKLQGIIYLSNDLTSSAFTEQRLALLKMLTGQIAISIENALFYSDLENKVQQRTNELLIEKKKSDDLLLNILPEEIATELKQTGRTKPRSYEMVTVMFTDFKDFTVESENLSPEELVTIVDNCFRKFDEITTKYNIEKIKTIGDAYLCVSGVPNPQDHNAANVARAAVEIIEYIRQQRAEHKEKGTPYFDIRIGIHSGPIVAGIVGNKKFAYDIWGDTVNTAARMEQNSETNKINITENTYNLIKDHFECTARGKKHAKNKGMIDMYFIEKEIVLSDNTTAAVV